MAPTSVERFLEREIAGEEVRSALVSGEVVAVEPASGVCHLITAYRPSPDRLEPDLKTRRKKS